MTGTSSIPIIVVAFVAIRKRKLINRFKNSDTTTEKNAKTIKELKISRRLFFRRLVSHGVIIKVNDRYYLDEQNLTEYNNRRRLIIIPLVILLILLVIFLDIVLT